MKQTLIIGIPAYNEEKNIKSLLESILRQKALSYTLKAIIISSDGSTDATVSCIRSLRNHKIKVIDNHNRRGIARGINQIISRANSDILVTLDADIIIKSTDFIENLIYSIIRGEADLTSSAIRYIKGKSLINSALQTSMDLKQILFDTIPKINNIYHCYGLARAFSRRFYNGMNVPISIGNDMYTYLQCVKQKYQFIYVKEAVAWYKLPSSFQDHSHQSQRFSISRSQMEAVFGKKLVSQELTIPISTIYKSAFRSIPVLFKKTGSIVLYGCMQFIILFIKRDDIKQAWDIAESSK